MLHIRTSLFSVNSTTEKSQIIFNYTHFGGKILSALILKILSMTHCIHQYRNIALDYICICIMHLYIVKNKI